MINIPTELTTGIREILIIDRTNKNKVVFSNLVTDDVMLPSCINNAMWVAQNTPGSDIRVYMNINSRNLKKAIYEFKRQMLLNDYAGNEKAYLKLDKKFRHVLMQPESRETRYFLIDIDKQDITLIHDVSTIINDNNIDVITEYATPNGYHYITKPFNPRLLEQFQDDLEIKTDALMLLWANGTQIFTTEDE